MNKKRVIAAILGSALLFSSIPAGGRSVSAASVTDLQQQAQDLLNESITKMGSSEDAAGGSTASDSSDAGVIEEASENPSADSDTDTANGVDITEQVIDQYTVIEINSREDFDAVVKNCHFDTWSSDKDIELNIDIDFNNEAFEPIRSFGGIFDGNGHTLQNVFLGGDVSETGVFGTIRRSGQVKNLNVQGIIDPDGVEARFGGIAGYNYGRIEGCTFTGRIQADRQLGGIAGHNGVYGTISGCSASGSISGKASCGGIVGYNEGTVNGCTNEMEVNTTYQDSTLSLDELTSALDNIIQSGDLLNSENYAVNGDSGGIAGFSSGVITACVNNGVIGYEHVGYNIGGIVGRSSGFLQNNINNGTIYGRKDVGGIAGQMQPYLSVEFTEEEIADLDAQLEELNRLVNTGIDNAGSYSADTLNHLQNINGLSGIARDATKNIADESADTWDEAAGKINNATSSLQDVLRAASDTTGQLGSYVSGIGNSVSGLTGDISSYLDGLEIREEDKVILRDQGTLIGDGLDTLNQAVTVLKNAIEGGNIDDIVSGVRGLESATASLRAAADRMQGLLESYRGLSPAIDQLLDDLGRLEVYLDKIDAVADGIQAAVQETLEGDGSGESGQGNSGQAHLEELEELLKNLDPLNPSNPDATTLNDLTDAISAVLNDINTIYAASADVISKVQAQYPDAFDPDNPDNVDRIRQAIMDDLDGITEEEAARLAEFILSLEDSGSSLSLSMDELQEALEEFESGTTDINEWIGNHDFPASLEAIASWLSSERDSLDAISAIINKYGSNAGDLSGIISGIRAIGDAVNGNTGIGSELSDALSSLASLDLQINAVSSTIRNNSTTLYDSLKQLQSEMDSLNGSMRSESGEGLDNLRAVTNQFNDILNTLQQEIQDAQDLTDGGTVEDISDQNISTSFEGRATSCTNNGEIHADTNLGGITGMVGVEFDLDPETDLRVSGSTSLDYIFRAKCIVDACINNGLVEARSSYSGGIAGQMEMGLVADSWNYGELDSESNYVGGISGYTTGLVRNCASKCDLSGQKYIGGIAGYGVSLHDNYALVNVTDGQQYIGAVAGKVQDINVEDIYENYYYSTEIYGINDVSYVGIAEGITYEELTRKLLGETLEDVSNGNNADAQAVQDASGNTDSAGSSGSGGGSGSDSGSGSGGGFGSVGGSGSVGGNSRRFLQLTLTFRNDSTILRVIRVNYGASVPDSQIPAVPDKEGFHGAWSRTDYSRIVSDETIVPSYTRINTLLSSGQTRENGLSIIEAGGNFMEDDELLLTMMTPEGGETERWDVIIPSDGLTTHEIRYLPPDGNADTKIYLILDGKKTEIETSALGQYLTFDVSSQEESSIVERIDAGNEDTEILFAAEVSAGSRNCLLAVAACAAAAALLILILILVHRRKKAVQKRKRAV